jgi:mercuric ion binding protein
MRKLLIATLTFLPLIAMAATPATITLDVKNMTCATCPITVKKSLEKVSGVSTVKVDYGKKTATVTFDPDKTKPDALTHATTDAGFPSTVRK